MIDKVKCPICKTEHETADYYGLHMECGVCKTVIAFDVGVHPILTEHQRLLLKLWGELSIEQKKFLITECERIGEA